MCVCREVACLSCPTTVASGFRRDQKRVTGTWSAYSGYSAALLGRMSLKLTIGLYLSVHDVAAPRRRLIVWMKLATPL